MNRLPINRYLDYAVLKPEMTMDEIKDSIQTGIDYDVRTICVRPCSIELAEKMCSGTNTDVSCVLSFPHGQDILEIKTIEAQKYIDLGTKEIDMVTNYSYIRSHMWDEVIADINAVSKITGKNNILLKVIIETSTLSLEEIAMATKMCIKAEADFVKSSTGFNGAGAAKEGIQTMIDNARGIIKVKASGGIRTIEQANMFIDMGCERLGVGASSAIAICDGENAAEKNGEEDY